MTSGRGWRKGSVVAVTNVALGIIAIAVAVAAVLIWRYRRRRELAELVSRADCVRSRLAEARARLEVVADTIDELVSQLRGDRRDELQAALSSARAEADEASTAIGALPTTMAGAPSPDETRALERRATGAMSGFDRAVRHAAERSQAVADRLAAVSTASTEAADSIAETRAVADRHRRAGWKVDDILGDVDRLTADLASVDTEPPLDLDVTETELGRLLTTAAALRAEAEGLPQRHRDLMTRAAELEARVEELRADREWLDQQLEAWALLHHPRSLVPVSEHPPAVTGRLDEAQQLLTTSAGDGGLLSMNHQDVRGATTAIERATVVIDQSEELIDEARKLSVDLATSAVEAERTVAEARTAAAALAAYVADHLHDLEKTFAEPSSTLASQVDEAEAGLVLDPPDSLGAMKLAREVIESGTAKREAARSEVERMNALRASARRALSRARSAVGELDDYTDGILAELFGGSRRRNVERLRTELRSAERLNELRVNDPQRAEREARAVATEARRLRERYEEEDRDEERRRRRRDRA